MKAGGQDAMTSSKGVEWYTPKNLLDAVHEVAPIYLDPCWAPGSLVLPEVAFLFGPRVLFGALPQLYLTNGLARAWAAPSGKSVFVNPPYGRGMASWVERCEYTRRSRDADHVIALLPNRSEMAWFQKHVSPETAEVHLERAVCFLEGRVRFSGAKAKAPFPSIVAYWGLEPRRFEHVFEKLGTVWRAT